MVGGQDLAPGLVLDDKSHHLEPVTTFPADVSQHESRVRVHFCVCSGVGYTSPLLPRALDSVSGPTLRLLGVSSQFVDGG